MRRDWTFCTAITSLAGFILMAGLPCGPANGSTYKLVATLNAQRAEGGVQGVLASDSENNLYATAVFFGVVPFGALYEVTASSGYSEVKTLYTFNDDSPQNGFFPEGVTLIGHNVILGTTFEGGVDLVGTVYNLGTARTISFTALHDFYEAQKKPTDGAYPLSGLTPGPFGRFYGTTIYGGSSTDGGAFTGNGILYQISQSTTDPHYAVLHRFGAAGDGFYPTRGNLVADAQGRLYGETLDGGANGLGTVFMIQYMNGGWHEQVIYSFQTNDDLRIPTANVVLDGAGNLYGCAQGGTLGQGGIFSLSPPTTAGGLWQEAVLYNFGDRHNDPVAAEVGTPVTNDFGCGNAIDPSSGVIVGTSYGGGNRGLGTIFTLTPPAAGQTAWTEAVGHSFSGHGGGEHPDQAPLRVGGIYYGGNHDQIYAFTP